MGWIWVGVALLSLTTNTLGQYGYSYPSPQKPLEGGATQGPGGGYQSSQIPGGFPAPTYPSVIPGAYPTSTSPTGYPEQPSNGYPSFGRPGGIPTGPSDGYPSTTGYPGNGAGTFPVPQSTGYPAAGRPNGVAFLQGPRPGGFPKPSPTPSPGPFYLTPRPGVPLGPNGGQPQSQFPSATGYPAPVRPLVPSPQPGQPSLGYPGNGGYPSVSQGGREGTPGGLEGYPAPQGSGRLAPEGEFTTPSEPQGEQGFVPSEAEEGDYSAIPGEPDIDYPVLSYVPETSFTCDQQQYPGYYADVETRCQVFHICANNKTYDFLCPNGTIFHQEHLVCVWWNQFDCNSAPSFYGVNANIYDYSVVGAQQQTGAIPAGPGIAGDGEHPEQPAIPSATEGGPEVPGYQLGEAYPTGNGYTIASQGAVGQPTRPPQEPSAQSQISEGPPVGPTKIPVGFLGSQGPGYLPPRPGGLQPGQTPNGRYQQANGGYPNGQLPNGGYRNGQPANGKQSNGQYRNGGYSNGQSSNGKKANGGYSNGKPSNGKPSNGKHPNGQYPNGGYSNGQPSNGKQPNGLYPNGGYFKGKLSNGQQPSGQYPNGVSLNGLQQPTREYLPPVGK